MFGLALLVDVGFVPVVKAGWQFGPVERLARLQRLLVVDPEAVEVGGPAVIVRQDGPLLLDETSEFVDANPGDEELQAGTGTIRLLSEAGENTADRLADGEQLLLTDKLVEQLCLVRNGAEAATYIEFEAPPGLAIDGARDTDGTDVVHVDEPAGFVAASREGDLHLAAEVLCVGVPEKEAAQGPAVRRDIEGLGVAHPGEGAGGDVAHRVAAGLAGRDTDGGEAPHQVDGIVDVDIVELQVLTSRDVQDVVRVFLGQVGERLHLHRIEAAEGNLDPLHSRSMPDRVRSLGVVLGVDQLLRLAPVEALAVVITLPIGAPTQAGLGENDLVDLALLAQFDFGLEDVDLAAQVFGNAVAQLILPGQGFTHVDLHLYVDCERFAESVSLLR